MLIWAPLKMPHPELKSLPIAVRVYPEMKDDEQGTRSNRRPQRPDAMLVLDTETRTDETQRLTFGSYRFIEAGLCKEEGLFYGDDLPQNDRRILDGMFLRMTLKQSPK